MREADDLCKANSPWVCVGGLKVVGTVICTSSPRMDGARERLSEHRLKRRLRVLKGLVTAYGDKRWRNVLLSTGDAGWEWMRRTP